MNNREMTWQHHQIATIRKASATKRQHQREADQFRRRIGAPDWLSEAGAFADRGCIGLTHIHTNRVAGRNNKGPGMAGAFDARPEPSLISARC